MFSTTRQTRTFKYYNYRQLNLKTMLNTESTNNVNRKKCAQYIVEQRQSLHHCIVKQPRVFDGVVTLEK